MLNSIPAVFSPTQSRVSVPGSEPGETFHIVKHPDSSALPDRRPKDEAKSRLCRKHTLDRARRLSSRRPNWTLLQILCKMLILKDLRVEHENSKIATTY